MLTLLLHVHVYRILVTHLPEYKREAESVVWHIDHEKQLEMSKKSNIVSRFL